MITHSLVAVRVGLKWGFKVDDQNFGGKPAGKHSPVAAFLKHGWHQRFIHSCCFPTDYHHEHCIQKYSPLIMIKKLLHCLCSGAWRRITVICQRLMKFSSDIHNPLGAWCWSPLCSFMWWHHIKDSACVLGRQILHHGAQDSNIREMGVILEYLFVW